MGVRTRTPFLSFLVHSYDTHHHPKLDYEIRRGRFRTSLKLIRGDKSLSRAGGGSESRPKLARAMREREDVSWS